MVICITSGFFAAVHSHIAIAGSPSVVVQNKCVASSPFESGWSALRIRTTLRPLGHRVSLASNFAIGSWVIVDLFGFIFRQARWQKYCACDAMGCTLGPL